VVRSAVGRKPAPPRRIRRSPLPAGRPGAPRARRPQARRATAPRTSPDRATSRTNRDLPRS
jgi:hypothetical protein